MNNILIIAILIIVSLNIAFYVWHDGQSCIQTQTMDMKSSSISHPSLRESGNVKNGVEMNIAHAAKDIASIVTEAVVKELKVHSNNVIPTTPALASESASTHVVPEVIMTGEDQFQPQYSMVGIDEKTRELFMQFIDQHEATYLGCLNPSLPSQADCKIGASHTFSATPIMRRLQKMRLQQNQRLNTVQIGVMDGKSNDPLYIAYLNGKEPLFSVANWHSILVEPAFMKELKHTYDTDVFVKSDIKKKNVHFIEGAFNEASKISKGKCHFYKVLSHAEGCPLKKTWAPQISTLDQRGLEKFFGHTNYPKCVHALSVSCWTMGTLLQNAQYDIELRSKPEGSGQEWCVKPGSDHDKNKVDMLVVDAEGFDGMIVRTTLKETCPELWPSIILYEDKVVRYNSITATNSSSGADSIIEFLEDHGYYCLIVGEDVLCMRVGYRLSDFKHASFSKRIYGHLNWLHRNAKNYPITTANSDNILKVE